MPTDLQAQWDEGERRLDEFRTRDFSIAPGLTADDEKKFLRRLCGGIAGIDERIAHLEAMPADFLLEWHDRAGAKKTWRIPALLRSLKAERSALLREQKEIQATAPDAKAATMAHTLERWNIRAERDLSLSGIITADLWHFSQTRSKPWGLIGRLELRVALRE